MLYSLDDIFIINNIEYTIESIVDGICTMEAIDIMNESLEGPLLIDASELPLPMYPDNYFGEMSAIGSSEKPQLSIWINPDPGRIGNPYFKVYNSETPKPNNTKVMRLHFFDSGMEYHNDKYLDWVPSNKHIKWVKEFLLEPHEDVESCTNWDMCKFLWNVEYHFFPRRMREEYLSGMLDDQFKDHPSYVPSTTEIPETWEYNPPKGKNKRR